MGKLQDFVRECIINCKASAEINTQSKAEVLLEKFAGHLDENGGGSGSGGSGGDMPTGGAANQQLVTDADGKAEWQDRTHWKEPDEIILPTTTATVNADLGFAPIAASPGLEIGKEYIVTYNGTEYHCIAIQATFDGLLVIALGNMGAMGSSAYEVTEEPFIFGDMGGDIMGIGASSAIIPLDGGASASVSIRRIVCHPLDKGFMYEGFVPIMIVNISSDNPPFSNESEWVADKTYGEVVTAIHSGKLVCFKGIFAGDYVSPIFGFVEYRATANECGCIGFRFDSAKFLYTQYNTFVRE